MGSGELASAEPFAAEAESILGSASCARLDSEANLSEHFRRTDPRYSRRLEVEVLVGEDRHVATTRNISLGGVFVETTAPLPLQTRLQIRFRIPTQSEPIEVGGEVRWVEPAGEEQLPGMGIRFQGLRAREVWALNRFFQG
jgi:type IV pilus assembly protein PilZ